MSTSMSRWFASPRKSLHAFRQPLFHAAFFAGFADFFAASGFARGFASKGSMSSYLGDVPVWLVTADYPGLEGAGVALEQALAR